MTVKEIIDAGEIKIDFENADISYGKEQAYVSYPVVFPTVNFNLETTEKMFWLADEQRIGQEIGEYSSYDYFIGISEYDKNDKVDNYIEFVVNDESARDNGELYQIPLSADERSQIWKILNDQCKEHLGKDCNALLREAARQYGLNAYLKEDKSVERD